MAKKKETPKENNEFVVIETGSKQYTLEVGQVVSIEKINHSKNNQFTFDTVLLHSKDGKSTIGSPYLDIAVQADIIQDEKDKKVRVFKFKKKTGYKKTQGHRQTYTTVRVKSIVATKKAAAKKTEKPSESKSEK